MDGLKYLESSDQSKGEKDNSTNTNAKLLEY